MGDKTYKNFFDDGYTTYHDDGSKSTTYKNLTNDGYTTYHDDGGKSTTYRNILDDGYTTYHDNGGKSTTYRNILDDGYTTFHDDGSKSTTYRNFSNDGYTTYHTGGSGAPINNSPVSSSSYGGYGYSSGYVYNNPPDASCIVVGIIACVLVTFMCWLYTTSSFLLPSVVFDVTAIVTTTGFFITKGRSFIWSWLFYMGATASLMLMVNNINFKMDSVFSLLIWLTPIVNAVIVGFFANIMDFEDSFAIPVAPFLFFGAAWFCCIYKTNYPDIYDKCIFFETIALIVLGLITLLVGVISARKQKDK